MAVTGVNAGIRVFRNLGNHQFERIILHTAAGDFQTLVWMDFDQDGVPVPSPFSLRSHD
jgi:hypothetical protein